MFKAGSKLGFQEYLDRWESKKDWVVKEKVLVRQEEKGVGGEEWSAGLTDEDAQGQHGQAHSTTTSVEY